MILRRIAKGIKEQDWFVVSIEVMIVVIGIFLGMQVTDWNEERKQKNQVKEAMQNLLVELEAGANKWVGVASKFRDNLVDQRILVTDFSKKTEIADHYDRYQAGLQTLGHYPSVESFDSVYRELQARGQLQLLDKNLRKLVENYYKEVEFYREQLDQFRPSSMPLDDRMVNVGIYYKYNLEQPGFMRVEYDFMTLVENDKFMSDLVLLARNQTVFQRYRLAAMEAALAACEGVATELKVDCNVMEVPEEVKNDPVGRLAVGVTK